MKIDICPKDVHDLALRILEEHHAETLSGVTFKVLYMYGKRDKAGELVGPAIRSSIGPVDSKTVITRADVRLSGSPDLIIYLDGDLFPEMPAEEQAAIIDEAFERIEPVLSEEDENGNVEALEDDAGRPKLRKRDCDMVVAGYRSIVERHGACSPFVRTATDFCETFGGIRGKFSEVDRGDQEEA